MKTIEKSRKRTKKFEFILPMPSVSRGYGSTDVFSLGDLTISGSAYHFPNEEPNDRFDYDIDEVMFNDINIINVLKWMEGSVKEIDEVHNAAMSHITWLFSEKDVDIAD